MTVPPLTFRLDKGSPLNSEEHDENLRILRDFCDGLAKLFEIVFNADGTLKDDAVITSSIGDRQVTQRKLDWLANFFSSASGVDVYSATISPDTGFTAASYGDGAAASFFCIIRFTNANTGPSTLNVNGGGDKVIKKLTGEDLVAGDILAGSIHMLAYDGTDFQLLSPSPVVDVTQIVGAHGVPNFITPVELFSGSAGAVGPTIYDTLVDDGVPATASAVILEADWALTGPDPNPISFIIIRKETGGDDYILSSGNSGGTDDAVGGSNQGIFPVKNTAGVLSLEYEVVTGFNNGYSVRVIGYIS